METSVRDILKSVGRLNTSVDDLDAQADLFASGLSSLATVDVMLAVEDRFNVEFPDELLCRRTFQSIAALSSVVSKLQAA